MLKYQRKTKELVDVLIIGKYLSAEEVLDFVCDCTIANVQINSIVCSKESNDTYYYTLVTSKRIEIAYYKKGQYIVRNSNNEIEIYNKKEFDKEFTTPWEY